MKWLLNQKVSTMQFLVVSGTNLEVAPNTKKNYKQKTMTLYVLKNHVTKCANTKAKTSNQRLMKLSENQPLKYCTKQSKDAF